MLVIKKEKHEQIALKGNCYQSYRMITYFKMINDNQSYGALIKDCDFTTAFKAACYEGYS